jgi:hypothetical protein
MPSHHALAEASFAPAPHPSLGRHAETYARVMGSWEGELVNHMVPGTPATSVEAHFGWALDGRAVQDVWITPARKHRLPGSKPVLDWYGTTLRVFDPGSEAWRTVWTDPASQLRIELEGRRVGDDIVQLGRHDGRAIRWTFSAIRERSFSWQAHALDFDGSTWRLQIDILFRRMDGR